MNILICIKQVPDFKRDERTFSSRRIAPAPGYPIEPVGNPLLAAYWLAKNMLELGDPLKAGDVILSGALGPMFPFAAGDYLHLSIAGLGTVDCRTA